MIQLNYRDSKPIYEQIKDGLRKLVISNSLSADEKLPSVRELAAKLAINPNTIQKAYRDLESEGYIYTVTGKGTFVAERKEVYDARAKELLTEFDEKAYIDGVKKQSYADGEEKTAKLVVKLKESGRTDELIKMTDKKELERLYKEYNIQ